MLPFPPGLVLDRLVSAEDPRFTRTVSLYRAAFPAAERKATAQLRAMLLQPAYRFLLAVRGGDVIGFAVLFCSPTVPVALLEYLAIDGGLRGHGIGRWLFAQTVQQADPAQRPLLIEAESDREAGPGQADRRRRKAFYRSLGAREIHGLRYLMPPVAAAVPPAMELLLHAVPRPTSVLRSDLGLWLQTVYREVYAQDGADPRLAAMLAPLPEAIPLR